jgi:23S rRNA (adenine-N6)-dimethyltransferase
VAGSRRQWGWHELRPEWAHRLVDLATVVPGQLVVDIGAGRGAVTSALVARGAHVIAVELHAGRARALRERFGREVVVVEQDAVDLRLPTRPFAVVASLPFGATTAVLRRLVHAGSRLDAAHVIVQAQAASRWSSPAAPGAVRWQATFRPSVVATVPRRAFTPPPQVATRVLALRRRS